METARIGRKAAEPVAPAPVEPFAIRLVEVNLRPVEQVPANDDAANDDAKGRIRGLAAHVDRPEPAPDPELATVPESAAIPPEVEANPTTPAPVLTSAEKRARVFALETEIRVAGKEVERLLSELATLNRSNAKSTASRVILALNAATARRVRRIG